MSRTRRSPKKHSVRRLGQGKLHGTTRRRGAARESSVPGRAARRSSTLRRVGVGDLKPSRVVGLKVELTVTVLDGRTRDTKRIERAGLVGRPAGGAKRVFPRLQDRESAARRVSRGVEADKLARLLAAMAHHQRLGLLLKLLGGEATHQLLTKATGLKTGPLYHHLRELRSAGLIGPKVRDLYVLTPKGRRAILAALAMERLCR